MTRLYEVKCACGNTAWSRTKPQPPGGSLVKKYVFCKKCRRPMREATGNVREHYSTRELL